MATRGSSDRTACAAPALEDAALAYYRKKTSRDELARGIYIKIIMVGVVAGYGKGS